MLCKQMYDSPERASYLGNLDSGGARKKAIDMVGSMGGHLGRKSDGSPGTEILWRGLQRLDTATEMYAIFTHQEIPNSMQSGP